VDTNGLMLGCVVTPADVGDRAGATELLGRMWLKYPRLCHLWADGNYDGPLVEWAKNCWGYTLEIVQRPPEQKGFAVLPRRWVVERTLAWLGQWRRLAKDYEQSPCSEVAFIQVAMIGLMLNRLA
jgi:transposase